MVIAGFLNHQQYHCLATWDPHLQNPQPYPHRASVLRPNVVSKGFARRTLKPRLHSIRFKDPKRPCHKYHYIKHGCNTYQTLVRYTKAIQSTASSSRRIFWGMKYSLESSQASGNQRSTILCISISISRIQRGTSTLPFSQSKGDGLFNDNHNNSNNNNNNNKKTTPPTSISISFILVPLRTPGPWYIFSGTMGTTARP